ncbi:MerR family transcriptional regulator [Paenibacillus thermotolerans]|uniref:MerR family transcriptional regulator n=1 Tax=Paenibacillus thermotolerans TaxID=3027807 RepID=UPI002367DDA0|nr:MULTISPECIES: MerR family transcriptional regulator [unclassified Paenibacillus]
MENTFTIQQISKHTGLSSHTLRYYEKIGLLQAVRRDCNGYREYTESDIDWIHFLNRLKETGMKISDMKRFSDLRYQGETTIGTRRLLLEVHRNSLLKQIESLKNHLNRIDEKIEYYKGKE